MNGFQLKLHLLIVLNQNDAISIYVIAHISPIENRINSTNRFTGWNRSIFQYQSKQCLKTLMTKIRESAHIYYIYTIV